MNCSVVEPLLSAYVDGELAPSQVRRVDEHLGRCARCAQQLGDLQMLQASLGAATLYHSAPGTLRSSVESALSVKESASALYQPVTAKSVSSVIVTLVVLAGLTGIIWWTWFSQPPLSLAEQAVRSHARAKEANRLTEVTSADARTISAWLAGKGHALTVPDLAQKGFPLAGARVEQVNGKAIPVLVYSNGDDTLNVYQWPTECGGDQSACTSMIQGYRLVHWVDAGMAHWTVSHLPAERLEEFAQLMRGK